MGGYLSTGNVTGVSGEVIKTDVDSAEKVADKVTESLKTDLDSGNSEYVSADVSGKSLNSESESKSETIPESKSETPQEPAKVVEIEPATVTQHTDVSKKSKRKNKHPKNQK